MNAAAHLILTVGENLWPALESLLHWQRQPDGIRRLLLYPSGDALSPREPARRLERFVRDRFPELEVIRRESGPESKPFRQQLEAWFQEAPEDPWILDLTGTPRIEAWGAEAWFSRPNVRITLRDGTHPWLELRLGAEGALESSELADFRRDATDDLPLADLVKVLWNDASTGPDFRLAAPQEPLPIAVALTEAAINAQWQWADAFRAAGLPVEDESDPVLFGRYLVSLVVALGIPKPLVARRITPAPAGTPADPTEIWIHLGGRIVVLDADLTETPSEPPADAPSPLVAHLERAARIRSTLPGTSVEWVFLRPAYRLNPTEAAVVRALSLTFVDQDQCHSLPGWLAGRFTRPLSTEGIEIERQLQAHLTRSGNTRAFAPEPAALRSADDSRNSDPHWANADVWLDRVMRERGQNWLLSTHRGRSFLRVPAEGRAAALQEWRLLALHTSGLNDADLVARSEARGNAVLIEFPSSPDANRRVAAWLHPFLNRPVTFADAQLRFAVQARIEAEAVHTAGVPSRSAPPAGATPPPAAAQGRPSSPRPAPRPRAPRPPAPPRPAPAPEPKPRRNPLADLDQALDDALGN